MKRKTSEEISIPAIAVMLGVVMLGLFTLLREGPALRRYLRMMRM